MTDSNDDECPICFEHFQLPKLLPCSHTFCFKCVTNFRSKSEGMTLIKCPICRSTVHTDSILPNYFRKAVPIPKLCHCCSDIFVDVSKYCEECWKYFCSVCIKSHSHSSNDTASVISDTDTLFGRIKTKYLCYHLNTVYPTYGADESSQQSLNRIRKGTGSTAYVIIAGQSIIYKYNREGRLIRKIPTPTVSTGVVECRDGVILAAFPEEERVMSFSLNKWQQLISVLYRPEDVSETADETILVCGNKLPPDYENNTGIVELFSKQGQLLKSLCHSPDNKSIYSTIYSVSTCKTIGTYVICNSDSVRFLFSNGEVTSVYKGTFSTRVLLNVSMSRSTCNMFSPLDICCHGNEQFLVSEGEDGHVHVLNPLGQFRGLLFNHIKESGTGLPGCVCVDDDGYIWIEDRQNKCIKIFKYRVFENRF